MVSEDIREYPWTANGLTIINGTKKDAGKYDVSYYS